MSTKKMSLEEKRTTILNIYHSTKDVYVEKEIQTLAQKAGVASGSILDVNQSLIDDSLVTKEKIGGSNFMFAFPGAEDRKMHAEMEEVKERVEASKRRLEEAEASLSESKVGREDEGGERSSKLQKLQTSSVEKKDLESQLSVLKENDPQVIQGLQKEVRMCQEAANRWTDNVFACKSYLVKKRGMEGKEADKILQINGSFDYPPDLTRGKK
jgi:hypothetical protein